MKTKIYKNKFLVKNNNLIELKIMQEIFKEKVKICKKQSTNQEEKVISKVMKLTILKTKLNNKEEKQVQLKKQIINLEMKTKL